MTISPILSAQGVSKSFGGVRALRRVDFGLVRGEVHAVVGENGAGKSTLMKVLAGLERVDEGELRLRGEAVWFRGPRDAWRSGVHVIHQELMVFPNLTVAENLFAGHEPAHWLPGLVDWRGMRRAAGDLLQRLGFDLDPGACMGDLTVAQMQVAEIARALSQEADVLIMDEPTSALSTREAERLFGIVMDLRARGVAVVYVSHKLGEVFRLADRITVLRDGERVATCAAGEVTEGELIRQMVGREVPVARLDSGERSGEVLLEVRGLERPGRYMGISFKLHRAEVVGLAGLVGAGRTDVANGICGMVPAGSGEIRLGGRRVTVGHPAEALRLGMAMVTEDRQGSGLVETLSVCENLVLSKRRMRGGGWWIDRRGEGQAADRWIRGLGIKVREPSQRVNELSGGNQQKVVLGRALMTEPSLLILDEPTRGIDVGAKAEIYAVIRRLRRAGLGILLVSSELPELLVLCDRILVMCEGRLTADLDAAVATEEAILAYAMPGRPAASRSGFREAAYPIRQEGEDA